ncbi:hypothetical protein [Saccharothrix variisporea]|uniref:hypothetical protein n=1 Tax=Saccharothrix variisporea TaxID=543527 RepID=UPI001476AD42|nr:hypothetical protein [Saccharothrix variisporea]
MTAREYAAVMYGVWALLNAAGLGEDSSLRRDDGISDAGLNARLDADVRSYSWWP